MSEQTLLSIRGLTICVPGQTGVATVVDHVDLDVAPGRAVGLVGESGCGKTTTLRAILKLLHPAAQITAGTITFAGRDLLGAGVRELTNIRGREIGVVWQDPLAALDPVMRAGAQIAETIRSHEPVNRATAERRAKELMRLVELPDIERSYQAYPHELSGGQRQRVVIACAIASSPKLLLADEPTTALDVTVQAQILHLLSRLRDELDLALVLVSHDLAVVSETCDDIAVMYAGRIVEAGPTSEVLAAPGHHYTGGLLQAAPSIDRIGHRPRGIAGTAPSGAEQIGCGFAPRCAHADELCRDTRPNLVDSAATPGHCVACHHPIRVLSADSASGGAA